MTLGEEFKELVHEAVDRALGMLGPFAQEKVRKLQALVDVTLQRPALVTEVHGRSILLPLVVVLVRELAGQLNLAATVSWDPGIVWTGDVDAHGNLQPVAGLEEKLERVVWSRAKGLACPAADADALRDLLSGQPRAQSVELFPVTNLIDVTAPGGSADIKSRSLLTRGTFVLKRASKPLGIAGTIAILLLLIVLGYSVPRLSSWLDRMPVTATITADSAHLELRNSRERTLRVFPISRTSLLWTVIDDVDDDGAREIFYGTGAMDPAPGRLFCLDSKGHERWRFLGGFRDDELAPYPLANSFSMYGVSVWDLDHDGNREVLVVLKHHPYYASQLALLRSDGGYVSSFWHPRPFQCWAAGQTPRESGHRGYRS